MPEDRADWRSTWHTAHVLTALNADEDFEPDDEFMQSLIPDHGMITEPDDVEEVDEVLQFQQEILANFNVS